MHGLRQRFPTRSTCHFLRKVQQTSRGQHKAKKVRAPYTERVGLVDLEVSRMVRKWQATVLSVATAVVASVTVPLWAAPTASAANSDCVPVVVIPLRGSG